MERLREREREKEEEMKYCCQKIKKGAVVVDVVVNVVVSCCE